MAANPPPPQGTVLQVLCGSCGKIVNVPAAHLDSLLMYKMYVCPNCKSRQSIQLAPQQETVLRIQARQLLQAQEAQRQQQQHRGAAAAAGQAAPQAWPPQANPSAAAMGSVLQALQQAMAAQRSAAGAAAQRPAAAQPAAASGASLGQQAQQALLLLLQQQQLKQAAEAQAAPAAAAAAQPQKQAAGAKAAQPAASVAQQQLLQLVLQHQQRQAAGAQGAQPAAAAVQQLLQQVLQQQQQRQAAGGQGAQQQQLQQLQQLVQQAAKLQQNAAGPGQEGGPTEPTWVNWDEVDDADENEVRDTFTEYKPAKLDFGNPHPDSVVETASLAAVEPPDITYQLKAKEDLLVSLSALQLESVVYACQRHEQMLPDGSRGGFFIGDGAGVGKGRTIAGLILENWRQGRRKHLWLSVGSDLKIDTARDLNDVGAADLPLHALNKLPYGKLAGHKIGVREGVIFLTYSSLISSSDRGHTRFKQLVEWCGKDFDGLIVFDESHKAKNLVPEAGLRATQVGLKVRDLQQQLPLARVVYCSATGASEPRNMGYMVRLGLWGEGSPAFRDFPRFLEAVQGKAGAGGGSMAALELVAMDMKAQGAYVCRTLSFAGAEFETVEAPLEEPVASQYVRATETWNQLFREFLYAEEAAEAAAAAAAAAGEPGGAPSGTTAGEGRRRGGPLDQRSTTWRSFWAGHQAFFRHMTMAAKVPAVVRMARAAVASGKCAVIGLQSTGEARTSDVVADRGEELDDFVSGPKELLVRLVDNYYPLPPDPNAPDGEIYSDSDYEVAAVADAVARNALEGRDQSYRGAKARAVRYREWSESEDIGDTASSDSSDGGDSSSASDDGASDGEGQGPAKKVARSASGARGAGDTEASGAEGRGGRHARSKARGGGGGDGGEDGSGEEYDPTAKAASSSDESDSGSGSDSGSDSDASDSDGDASSGSGGAAAADPAAKQRRREERLQRKAEQAEAAARRAEAALALYQAALKRKESVLAVVQQLELPSNPLDTLIDLLGGPAAVAEMTGRKGRLVRAKAGSGVVFEARNASGVGAGATLEMINVHERELFLGGTKLIAVISEAASAGISLHADLRAANQRRRVHLTLELPWSADKAIQQFGRTHRANQAHSPQYRLIFTPLGGERRFAAAVARRLQSLGALTQGDRRAGPSLAAYDYDSAWGQRALRETYRAITGDARQPLALPLPCRPGPAGEPPQLPLGAFLGKARALLLNVGVIRHNKAVVSAFRINEYLSRPEGAPPNVGHIPEKDMADVPRFLNRLLGLAPGAQAAVFDFFQATMEALMERARLEGQLDEGIVDVRAHSVRLVGEPRVLHRDATSGAATVMYEIELDRGLPWPAAEQKLGEHLQALARAEAGLASPGGAGAVAAVLASIPAPEGAGEGQEQGLKQEAQGEPGAAEAATGAAQQPGIKQEAAAPPRPSNGALPPERHGDGSPAAAAADARPPADEDAEPEAPGKKRQRSQQSGSPASGGAAEDAGGAPGAAKRSKPSTASPGQPARPAAPEEIDLTASGDEAPAPQPAASLPRVPSSRKKQRRRRAAASDSDVEVVEGSGAAPDGDGTPAAKRRWQSGFYRARQEGINRQVHVLLALQVAGSQPPTFAVYRPATGRSRQIMSLQELKARYTPLAAAACQPLWVKAFDAAGALPKEGKRPAVMRKKAMHVLGGAVMRSWAAVQAALARHVKSAERRMRVVRIATTGDDPQRLVGMLVPEAAVAEVVGQLQRAGEAEAEARSREQQATDARGSGAGAAAATAGAEAGPEGATSPRQGAGRGRGRGASSAGRGRGRGHGAGASPAARRRQPARGRAAEPAGGSGSSSDGDSDETTEEEGSASEDGSSEATAPLKTGSSSSSDEGGGDDDSAAARRTPVRQQPRRGKK